MVEKTTPGSFFPRAWAPGRRGARMRGRRTRLGWFLVAIYALALPLAAVFAVASLQAPVERSAVQIGVLVLALMVGELLPIRISHRGRPSDEITVSSTFALALVVTAPLGIAVLAQSLPLLFDDLRRGKPWYRPLFNVCQYTLTLGAARLAYVAVSGDAFFGTSALVPPRDLLAVLAAGAAFHLVNNTLVGLASALSLDEPVLPHLHQQVGFQLMTSAILLSLAPMAVVAVDYSPALLPVLLLPIAAVHHSAALAALRQHEALHDVLTGLPNRALLRLEFADRLDPEGAQHGLGVLLIDLDDFKDINGTLGHPVGDALLTEVAARLRAVLRPDDVVARLGGDEFAVLVTLPGSSRRALAEELATRVTTCLQAPFYVADVRLDVRASVGIALAPEHGTTIESLMSRADVALYTAKEERGRWWVYDPERDQHTPERLALLGELRDGIDRGELELRYQPKCALPGGEVTGVEALVRWRHPRKGLLPPDEFIPLAENTGLITGLTLAVLDSAVLEAGRWAAAGRPLGVAVNLSVRHLTDLQLPTQVDAVLRRHGLPARSLTLEVTESTIMNDTARAVTVLTGLRALGVRIAVDDYGTGYSSLAYLRQLDVDELKIDRSFIGNLTGSDNDEVIVRSTIELGHNLGLVVVAEGVEHAETWARLRELGCDVVQGYYVSRPLPADEFEAWLDAWDGSRATTPGRPGAPAAV